jgi:hypothetical protein
MMSARILEKQSNDPKSFPSELWHPSPTRRLKAARALSKERISELQKFVAGDAPMRPWPFGMATVANPYIVFLGPSPGNSRSSEDVGLPSVPLDLPTVGKPHPRMGYQDTRGFFDRIREATRILINSQEPTIPKDDPISLMGKLNLGVGEFGSANSGVVEDVYLEWTPRVIVQRLKPMLLVLVGMKGILKENPAIRGSLSSSFGVDLGVAKEKATFEYQGQDGSFKRLTYDLWTPTWNDHKPIVVQWPQHPSRAPFTNFEKWKESWWRFCGLDFVRDRLEG